MMKNAVVEPAWSTKSEPPFSREAVLRVLDGAPDGYKLLARLVDDPCDLVRDYGASPGERTLCRSMRSPRSRWEELQERLRTWLIAGLQQES